MSAVLSRAAKRRESLAEKLLPQLDRKRFSLLLRRETWSDHERAEYSKFEQSLVHGTVTRDAYREMVAQVYFVYCALEARATDLKDHPVAGRLYFEELHRKSQLEEDLEHFYGSDWRSQIEPLPVTEEYADRISTCSPAQFVAHHYTRYLADLSGGLMIYESLARAWNTSHDGLRYYDFAQIPDPAEFKTRYRETLDSLPLDASEKLAVVEETIVAYEYNIELIAELEARHPASEAS